jgi:protein SCO1/2
MTATFSRMRQALGKASEDLRMISISIDPEYDTRSVLEAYAERYQAGNGWQFLTGDKANVVSVLKAFDAYAGSKMNHRPLTFFKVPGEDRWLRIEGLASASDLAIEYLRLKEH